MKVYFAWLFILPKYALGQNMPNVRGLETIGLLVWNQFFVSWIECDFTTTSHYENMPIQMYW